MFLNGYLKNNYAERFVWKDINRQTLYYTRSFFCKNCILNNIHPFQIIVENNIHYISKYSVEIFCKLHNIDYQRVSTEISERTFIQN